MSRCGALVLEDVYGMSNVEDGVPLQPDAIFRLMSMSKPITAAAAMICYEAGHYQCAALPAPILSLSSSLRLCCCRMDDPLSMYLPEWGETKVFAGGTADEPLLVEQERPITIKHLLTHTSGMNSIIGRPEVNRMGARAMKAYATKHGGIQGLQAYSEAMASAPLTGQPGTRWLYGQGLSILGRAIEVWR